MPVVPGRDAERGPALRARLEAQLGRPVWIIHRLDRDTSGVLLVALDAASHRAASQAFEGREVRKLYLALVWPPLQSAVQVEAALVPARRARARVARPGEPGKPAVTELRPLGPIHPSSWWAVPRTGRTRRSACTSATPGAPLLVDPVRAPRAGHLASLGRAGGAVCRRTRSMPRGGAPRLEGPPAGRRVGADAGGHGRGARRSHWTVNRFDVPELDTRSVTTSRRNPGPVTVITSTRSPFWKGPEVLGLTVAPGTVRLTVPPNPPSTAPLARMVTPKGTPEVSVGMGSML
jgi:hypothetical protein